MKISRYNNFILKSQSEKSIEDICKKYNIKNYTINSDGSIDVDGNVYLTPNITYFTFKKLESIPLKFGRVSGHFNCSRNKLTSLEGAPKEVGGNFHCSNNQLTSLIDGPEIIIGDYYAYGNQIISFEGFPDDYEGGIDFSNNPVQDILDQFPRNLIVKAIHLINDYDAIWNGEVIPERLEMVKDKLKVPYDYKKIVLGNTSIGPR